MLQTLWFDSVTTFSAPLLRETKGANNVSRYDHVVIAVRELDNAVRDYQRLGFQVTNVRDVPGASIRTAEFAFPGGGYIELIMPLQPAGYLHHHLQTYGESVAALCLGVDSVKATLDHAERQGFKVRDVGYPPKPSRPRGFIDEGSAHGVPIEVVEGLCPVKAGYNSYTGWEDRQKMRNSQHGRSW